MISSTLANNNNQTSSPFNKHDKNCEFYEIRMNYAAFWRESKNTLLLLTAVLGCNLLIFLVLIQAGEVNEMV